MGCADFVEDPTNLCTCGHKVYRHTSQGCEQCEACTGYTEMEREEFLRVRGAKPPGEWP